MTYNLMSKRKWYVTSYAWLCMHVYMYVLRGYAKIMLYTSTYLSVYRALPRTEWIFLAFEGPFLKNTSSASVPRYCYTLPWWYYRHRGCHVFHSGMSVTPLPQHSKFHSASSIHFPMNELLWWKGTTKKKKQPGSCDTKIWNTGAMQLPKNS